MGSLQLQKRDKNGEKGTGSAKVDHMKGELVTSGGSYWIYDEDLWKNAKNGINAKDGTDSIVGSLELLNKYSNEYIPTSIWQPEEIREKNYDNAKQDVDKLLTNLGFF